MKFCSGKFLICFCLVNVYDKLVWVSVFAIVNLWCFVAVKILEKRHIMKENKAQYVKRERDVMSSLDHPFFVKLYFTFQDEEKLCILHTHTHTPEDTHTCWIFKLRDSQVSIIFSFFHWKDFEPRYWYNPFDGFIHLSFKDITV